MTFLDKLQSEIKIIPFNNHSFAGESHSKQLTQDGVKKIDDLVLKSDVVFLESGAGNSSYSAFGPQSASQVAERSADLYGKETIDLQKEMADRFSNIPELWQYAGVADNPARVQTVMVLHTLYQCTTALASHNITIAELPNFLLGSVLQITGVDKKIKNGSFGQSDKDLVETVRTFSTSIIDKSQINPELTEALTDILIEYGAVYAKVRDVFYYQFAQESARKYGNKKMLFVMGENHADAISRGVNGQSLNTVSLIEEGQKFLTKGLGFIQKAM